MHEKNNVLKRKYKKMQAMNLCDFRICVLNDTNLVIREIKLDGESLEAIENHN